MYLEKIKELYKKYTKDKEDKIFLGIFILTIIINIYFFTKTYRQALWFDEADYLNFAKYLAFGYPEWGLGAVRPPLFSLIGALFFKIGLGEIGLRILIMVLGIINTLLIYLIGTELENKKVGLIASITITTFWSYLFFSFRLLVDIPVLTFWLLTTYFFIRGYINNKSKILTWLIFPTLFIGFLMKYLLAILLIIILIYLLITTRLKFLKNKDLLMSIGLAAILTIPFFILEYIYYKSPIAFLTATFIGKETLGRTFWEFLILHIKQLFPMIGYVFLALFIIGIILLLEIFLGIDLIIKDKDKNLSKKLFLFIWLVGSLALISKIGYGTYLEERYSFGLFAAIFITLGIGMVFLYDSIKKRNKQIATIIIGILLIFGVYSSLSKANSLIEDKAQSFIQVKQAGEFLEKNLAKDEGYLSPTTSAEIQYHSNRKNMGSDIKEALDNQKIKYVIWSIFNQMPEQYTKFLQENQNKFAPAAVFFLDKENKQPAVVIFEIIR